jgi:hypothetical protein
MFASIGGMNKVISMIVGAFYLCFHQFASKHILVKEIFKIDCQTKSSWLQFLGISLDAESKKKRKAFHSRLMNCAESIIDHNLDVITLVKEISRMRLMLNVIMTQPMIKVEPFLTLTEELKVAEKKAAVKANSALASQKAATLGPQQLQPKKSSSVSFEQAIEEFFPEGCEPSKNHINHSSPNNEWHTDQHNEQGGNIDRGSSANQITESAKSKSNCLTIFQQMLQDSRNVWVEELDLRCVVPDPLSQDSSQAIAKSDSHLSKHPSSKQASANRMMNRIIPKPRRANVK